MLFWLKSINTKISSQSQFIFFLIFFKFSYSDEKLITTLIDTTITVIESNVHIITICDLNFYQHFLTIQSTITLNTILQNIYWILTDATSGKSPQIQMAMFHYLKTIYKDLFNLVLNNLPITVKRSSFKIIVEIERCDI